MKVSKYIGDKAFYRSIIAVAAPILLQNIITNFVNLLDNIMVGQVGTEPMSGVAIVNQLLFVFNLCIFGGLAGPGIFSAQFYGKGDLEGVRSSFRAKLYVGAAALVVFLAALLTAGEDLISLFLHEGQDATLDLRATLDYGMDYLHVILLQLLPFVVSQIYAGTLRESGETVLPMKAGIAAVFVNLFLNYVLIFGKFGAPALGVVGAAVATVIARFVECGIVVLWTHRRRDRCPYITGVYRSLRIPKPLLVQMAKSGAPLLVNELLWSAGMTMTSQCYSIRGLEVVSANNIASTVNNLFFCSFFAIGNSIAIMIGQLLGAGELDRAVEEDRQLITFSVLLNVVVGLVMFLCAPLIPQIYNTTDAAKEIAANMLRVSAVLMPIHAFTHASYFTLRSGGKTIITFLFDSAFLWVFNVPLAFVLSRYTTLPILSMFMCVQALEFVKCAIAAVLLRKRVWVNNLVKD